jgi:hypothetical protein
VLDLLTDLTSGDQLEQPEVQDALAALRRLVGHGDSEADALRDMTAEELATDTPPVPPATERTNGHRPAPPRPRPASTTPRNGQVHASPRLRDLDTNQVLRANAGLD